MTCKFCEYDVPTELFIKESNLHAINPLSKKIYLRMRSHCLDKTQECINFYLMRNLLDDSSCSVNLFLSSFQFGSNANDANGLSDELDLASKSKKKPKYESSTRIIMIFKARRIKSKQYYVT